MRARIYGAVAKAAEPEGRADKPASVAPALADHLRARLEEVRARLTALADAAATAEAPDTSHPWPPPDPRHAVPDAPPVPTTIVPVDLLARVDSNLATTRALLACIGTVLEQEPPLGAADFAGSSAPSPERDKACMVALNMALNGATPVESDRYLAEHFLLPDAHLIVAEAYAQLARMRALGGNGHGPSE